MTNRHSGCSNSEASSGWPSTSTPGWDLEALRTEFDERFDQIQQQLEALSEGTQETNESVSDETEATKVAETAEKTEEEPEGSLNSIKGLGTTYQQRLSDAGIENVGDLAESSPEEVADAADAPKKRATEWIERAKELREEQEAQA
ncbi:helix-hairpin-helix domain-containing protein [Haloferax gibbonsii]|uniref:helix-hairpin-helix domain-containing protein n=1 Tax=Haloferax gibbonsii TaxID=35746 RepID=UPI00373FD687